MKKFFKKIYNYFMQKKADKVVSKPVEVGNLKWGFVVPHTKAKAGAVLKDRDGKVVAQEYFYAKDALRLLQDHLGVTVGTRDEGGLNGAYGWLNIEGCTASIEPHLNAFNTKAKGYEVLVLKGDTTSALYAKELLDLFGKMYPDRVNRGIKYVKSGDNGFANLMAAKKNGMEVALLTELFFIDNKSEWISRGDMAQFFNRFLEGKDV